MVPILFFQPLHQPAAVAAVETAQPMQETAGLEVELRSNF